MDHSYLADYSQYRYEDFLTDPSFRLWVRQPNEALSHYWQDVLRRYPEQADTIAQAAEHVRLLSEATDALTPPANATEVAAIWRAIRAQLPEPAAAAPFRSVWRGRSLSWLLTAAAVVTLVGVGWWLRLQPAKTPPPTLAQQPDSSAIEQVNTTNQARLVSLPDGSSLLLQPRSRVRYARRFSGKQRRVDLTGEAYFEVLKDPQRPFLVYTDRLITKVLGTSFTVRAYAGDDRAVVTVRSGKVAVLKPKEANQHVLNAPLLAGTVLTPNQQLVVSRINPSPIQPIRLAPATAQRLFAQLPPNLIFEATPVSEVFSRLEKAYGVRIDYDRATLGACRLTADLSDEPLSEKMLIICKSIEANFTLSGDNQFTVTGPGCQS